MARALSQIVYIFNVMEHGKSTICFEMLLEAIQRNVPWMKAMVKISRLTRTWMTAIC